MGKPKQYQWTPEEERYASYVQDSETLLGRAVKELIESAGVVPQPGTTARAYVHTQATPSTVWTVAHGLDRRLVGFHVYSLDLSIQWDGVLMQPVTENICRLTFDDPTSGLALIV